MIRMRSPGSAAAGLSLAVAALMLAACEPAPPPRTATVATIPAQPPTIRVMDYLQVSRNVSPDWATINAQPLGSRGNPDRAEMPPGSRAYLARLVCSDGSRPAFYRVGNVGFGPYTTIIDQYEVSCGSRSQFVYVDMYHEGHIENRPAAGFSIRPAS